MVTYGSRVRLYRKPCKSKPPYSHVKHGGLISIAKEAEAGRPAGQNLTNKARGQDNIARTGQPYHKTHLRAWLCPAPKF
jgi:hypothetical protein